MAKVFILGMGGVILLGLILAGLFVAKVGDKLFQKKEKK